MVYAKMVNRIFFSNFGNAFRCAYFGSLPSIMRSSTTDFLEFLKNAFIMHELNYGLYADKLATFWMFPERLYRSFVLQMPLYTAQSGKRK